MQLVRSFTTRRTIRCTSAAFKLAARCVRWSTSAQRRPPRLSFTKRACSFTTAMAIPTAALACQRKSAWRSIRSQLERAKMRSLRTRWRSCLISARPICQASAAAPPTAIPRQRSDSTATTWESFPAAAMRTPFTRRSSRWPNSMPPQAPRWARRPIAAVRSHGRATDNGFTSATAVQATAACGSLIPSLAACSGW